MNKRNYTPLCLAGLLIFLICLFSVYRLDDQALWNNAKINFDIALAAIYIVWILLESTVSIREAATVSKTSDYGTCELYAFGQGAVIISALWFPTVWKTPNIYHFTGFLLFTCGLFLRGWAILTLGRYYSHKVRKVDKHTIIEAGPYRFLRHPAYSGMLLANVGIALFFMNLATTLILLMVLTPAIIARILIEERTLYKIEGYPDFAKTRKRIIPSLW